MLNWNQELDAITSEWSKYVILLINLLELESELNK